MTKLSFSQFEDHWIIKLPNQLCLRNACWNRTVRTCFDDPRSWCPSRASFVRVHNSQLTKNSFRNNESRALCMVARVGDLHVIDKVFSLFLVPGTTNNNSNKGIFGDCRTWWCIYWSVLGASCYPLITSTFCAMSHQISTLRCHQSIVRTTL